MVMTFSFGEDSKCDEKVQLLQRQKQLRACKHWVFETCLTFPEIILERGDIPPLTWD